jgi:hypothetical protein
VLMCRTIPDGQVPLWTGTHGEMISLDLHGAKSSLDGCRDPNRGQRPRGVVPFPLGCWPWKAHDVTQGIL